LEKRRLKGDPVAVYNFLKGTVEGRGTDLLSLVTSDRTQGVLGSARRRLIFTRSQEGAQPGGLTHTPNHSELSSPGAGLCAMFLTTCLTLNKT